MFVSVAGVGVDVRGIALANYAGILLTGMAYATAFYGGGLLHSSVANDMYVYDIDCHRSRCRVAMSHETEVSVAAFQRDVVSQLGKIMPDMQFHYEDLGGGTTETIIYLMDPSRS